MAPLISKRRTFRLSVPTEDLEAFRLAADAVGWSVEDTGDRVSTDDGEDAEAVLVVTARAPARIPA